MNIEELLYHYITDGIKKNKKNHVGIELEFPLAAENGGEISLSFLPNMFEALEGIGFSVFKHSAGGEPLSARDGDGNVLTFDTCYENIEFASASNPSMIPIYRRFREVLGIIQPLLRERGLFLLGLGFNPLLCRPHMIENELTLAIAEHLRQIKKSDKRRIKDFYCTISSEQVHFNTSEQELPEIFELFTRIDWLNILLFSNSPAALDGHLYLCARNELYMTSDFHRLGLVGAQRLDKSVWDIARSYEDLSIYMRVREGKYEVFSPVRVRDYFARQDALPEDINHIDIERNIVTTSYGTIEYRMLCAQPFGEAFTPSAFSLGLRIKLSEALSLARAFDERHQMPQPNERNRLASMGEHPFASKPSVIEFARELLKLSHAGLVQRGLGEEAFLAPLESRADLLASPAVRFMQDREVLGERAAIEKRAELSENLVD